jgi:1-acyl-sn-glycerol-3-phosphate acyltransferase
VIVFPEGTTTKGDDVLPFNSSFLQFAAETDLPVSYASVSYRTPEGEPPASETVCWWDDTPFLNHMLRMFSLSGFTAIVSFGEQTVISTDRKKLAGDLRDKVRERFIPVL